MVRRVIPKKSAACCPARMRDVTEGSVTDASIVRWRRIALPDGLDTNGSTTELELDAWVDG